MYRFGAIPSGESALRPNNDRVCVSVLREDDGARVALWLFHDESSTRAWWQPTNPVTEHLCGVVRGLRLSGSTDGRTLLFAGDHRRCWHFSTGRVGIIHRPTPVYVMCGMLPR